MKRVYQLAVIGLWVGLAYADDAPPAASPDTREQEQKFFWSEKTVPASLVQEILRLMNICLEQKITHDIFLEVLTQLLDQVKLISLDVEEKAKLQKTIQYLVNTLKKQSKSETRELKTLIKAVSQL